MVGAENKATASVVSSSPPEPISLPPEETETTELKSAPTANIAEKLDQEAPPPPAPMEIESAADAPDRDDSGKFFKGEAYEAAIAEQTRKEMSVRLGVVERSPSKDDYDDEDEYESEETSVNAEPDTRRFKMIAIALLLLFVVGGAAGLYIWSKSGARDFDSAPVLNEIAIEETPSMEPTPESSAGLAPSTGNKNPQVPEQLGTGAVQSAGMVGPSSAETVRKVDTPTLVTQEKAQPSLEQAEAEDEDTEEEIQAKPKEASAVATQTPEATPKAPSAEALAKYKALLTKADLSGGKARIKYLRSALALYPEGDEALAFLATMLMENKSTRSEALDLAQRATKANADNAMGWLAIGYIYQLEGDSETARDAYKKCASCSGPHVYVRECVKLLR